VGENLLAFQGLNISSGDADFLILRSSRPSATGPWIRPSRLLPEPTPGITTTWDIPAWPESRDSRTRAAATLRTSPSRYLRDNGGCVRYTIDGSEPTESSPTYSTPIAVSATRVVKAKGFRSGYLQSGTASRLYVRLASDATEFNSDLPIMVVETFGRAINSRDYKTSLWTLFLEPTGAGHAPRPSELCRAGRNGAQGLELPGIPETQLQPRDLGRAREDKDLALFGLPKESDWSSTALQRQDLIRNFLSYSWSNEIDRYARARCSWSSS